MQEIADWLTRLGLPEYAGAFAENGIDETRTTWQSHRLDRGRMGIRVAAADGGHARAGAHRHPY